MASNVTLRTLVTGIVIGAAAVIAGQSLVARGADSSTSTASGANRFQISGVPAVGNEPDRVYVLDALSNKVRIYRKAAHGWDVVDGFVISQ